MKTLDELRSGDSVIRMLAGEISLDVVVTRITEDRIFVSAPPDDLTEAKVKKYFEDINMPYIPPEWEFSRRSGAEIDEDLGWNEKHTGSYLKIPES